VPDLYDASIDSVEALVMRRGNGQGPRRRASESWRAAARWPTSAARAPATDAAELDGALPATQPMSRSAPRYHRQHLALRERGVTRDTPSPQGGRWFKDAVTASHGRVAGAGAVPGEAW